MNNMILHIGSNMKLLRNTLILLVVFMFSQAGNLVASDNYYLMQKAKQYQDEGFNSEAISFYKEYINTHPATLGNTRKQYIKNRQYYLRNLLIAYDNLFDLYRQAGDNPASEQLLTKLINSYQTDKFGAKNAYKIALLLLEQDLIEDAEVIIEKIIDDQEKSHRPYNNKVTLRCYSKLLNIYQKTGKTQEFDTLFNSLKSNYPSEFCDLKDQYTVASLLYKYDVKSPISITLLEKILADHITAPDSSTLNVAIKSFSKLMKIYYNKGDFVSAEALMDKTYREKVFDTASINKQYQIAMTFLNCNYPKEGKDILKDLVVQHPFSLQAKKSLFLLGRLSQNSEQWDEAIEYFSDYIARYPRVPFFSLKAYSKLLDSYFSRDGNSDFLEGEMTVFADIVNNISDYETILNLSRDIKWKGRDKLAASTFNLGMVKAREYISKNKGTFEELRARWIVERYAYAHELPEIVEENAAVIFLLADELSKTPTAKPKRNKIRFIKGQTHIWLAKIAADEKKFAESENHLKTFIKENPNDADIDYAWFHLGRGYEEDNYPEKALDSYRKVRKGVWENKARQKIKGLGNASASYE